MLSSIVRAVLVATVGLASVATAAPVWTDNARIESIIALEGYGILRIQVNTTTLANPAGCTQGPDGIDLQLDVTNRSPEEQRQLVNAVNLAFMTRRNVQFLVRDDLCSTAGTSARLRIAVGVRVFN